MGTLPWPSNSHHKPSKFGVQWNHCRRTYCNKNFRGWIAGSNPFCRLIEIRTLGYPGNSSHWFLVPFNVYQYTKHWLLTAISQKKDYVPQNLHAQDKYGATPGRFESLCSYQGWCQHLQPDANRTHWRSSDLGGCPWLVLACLACAAFLECCKNFSGPKNLIPRQNKFQALAWWNIWPIALSGMHAPEKTFRGLIFFFFPPPPLQPNTTPKWIGKTLTIWTP